jgi:hypothetical protein
MKAYIPIIFLFFCPEALSYEIDCLFSKLHLADHQNADRSGYSAIKDGLHFINGKSVSNNVNVKQASHSRNWRKLGSGNVPTTVTTYIGGAGDILTIEHKFGENIEGLSGWYSGSLVSSNVTTTITKLGKCLVRENK